MDLAALPITHRAVIPDTYLDEMGHMNVMWYTHLFSQAAWGLFQMVGFTLDYFKANRAGSFITRRIQRIDSHGKRRRAQYSAARAKPAKVTPPLR